MGSVVADSFAAIQGLSLVNGQLAVAYSPSNITIDFYNPFTFSYIRSITGSVSDEGLAYDGTFLWRLTDENVYGVDPDTGAVTATIPNPASKCVFNGTGLAWSGGTTLVAACSNGTWYRFSSLDGSVLASGNNGLAMYGLDYFDGSAVPEPSTWMLAGGALALVALRRRQN